MQTYIYISNSISTYIYIRRYIHIGSEFCWEYFRADYSIVLISETAAAYYPFVFHYCGDFILMVF